MHSDGIDPTDSPCNLLGMILRERDRMTAVRAGADRHNSPLRPVSAISLVG